MRKRPSTIDELMTPCPISIRPDQSLAEAHRLMRSHGIRHLPVLAEDRVIGVVTQGDLRLLESIGEVDIDINAVPVEEAMVEHPYMVWTDTPIAEVLGEMIARRIGSALVVDTASLDRGRVVGIFTAVDAMKALEQMIRTTSSQAEGS
jgi:acetoin utilization protein AcuB